MEEIIIHKVAFTEEAVFDYEHSLIVRTYAMDEQDTDWRLDSKYDLPLVRFPKSEMKQELEEYIQSHGKNKYKHYFRVNYYDDQMDRMLMFFIKRGVKISIMQNWTVVGICPVDDWTEELEDDGLIRAWYETKISDLDNSDWVEEKRIRQQIEEEERLKDDKERERYERLFA